MITTIVVLVASLGQTALAQSRADEKKILTLEEAVDFALKNYPAVRASLERVTAAQAAIGLAKTNYLPRADVVWQTNRATDNNITGLLLPQSIIAPISGPVPASTSNQSAWGSAAGLLFSWEPFDFGYRGAKVSAARTARDQATAEASLTHLDVAVATVNAYLTVLAAQRTVHAAEADVERRDTFDKAVRVLVDNQLRAGADASRADAELARARVNFSSCPATSEKTEAGAALAVYSRIARHVGGGGSREAFPRATSLTRLYSLLLAYTHPLAQVQQARVEEAQAQVHILDRSYYPKFYFQSSVYGRGSGWDPTGKFEGGTAGLGPDRSDWAVGLTVTFPIFDIFAIRSRKQVESANERSRWLKLRSGQALQDLTWQWRWQAQASSKGLARSPRIHPWNWMPRGPPRLKSVSRYWGRGWQRSLTLPTRRACSCKQKRTTLLRGSPSGKTWLRWLPRKVDLQPFLQFLHDKTQGGP